jgi:hypothetical protein
MPSPSLTATPERGAVPKVLDTTLGFFVWAAHLLTVYIAQALACARGVVGPRGQGAGGLLTLLVLVTLIAAGAVVLHAVKRWRERDAADTSHFRATLTVGCDAIATLAIVWQGFAFALMPPCA